VTDGRDHYLAGALLADSWSAALGAGLRGLEYRVLGAACALLVPYGWIGDQIGGTQLAAAVYDLEAPSASHRGNVTAALRRLDEAGAISWIPGAGGARGWVILFPLEAEARAHVRARARAHVRARDLESSRSFQRYLALAGETARALPRAHSTKDLPLETSARAPSRNGSTETDTDYDEAEVERYAAKIREREARE
jgi:hypothetical protein